MCPAAVDSCKRTESGNGGGKNGGKTESVQNNKQRGHVIVCMSRSKYDKSWIEV